MSGFPNSEQIEALRAAAARVSELNDQHDRVTAFIRDHYTTLESIGVERGQRKKEVLDLLQKMDVASDRNLGWENRVVLFLAELSTTAEQYGRTHR